ncbi:serine hydrolase [uncultured Bacteroides sp.]|jgi:CubicO group peptidase (beta-lactamase class C family)/lysophospholipase L1-like esterase|uniref:serine hydrolase n=1 Tax=Bacteroides stercorirosoris TaxID=871324 RepID=UPI00258839E2|nr:serine hydrolase [uncultured Bacteroides sp.]
MKLIPSFLFLALLALQANAQPLQRIAPEQVGMDSRKLMYADEAIETAIANKDIPGAVLAVVRNGKMAYLKAYGNKRIYPNAEPMTVNTIFDMASCSKSMSTAICTHILAERGKLRLLDPVSLYIPDFKNWASEDGKDKKVIRIADLLTHTSGLPPYAPTSELEKQYGSPSPDGLIEYIANCRRDFKPQTDFQYSCLNYITLQRIIETVSGQSLRDFARKNLFDVLGMNHTDYLPCKRDKDGKWINTSLPHWAKTDTHSAANRQLSTVNYQLKEVAPTEKQPDGSVLCGQVHDPLARVMNGGISGNAGVFSCAEDIALLCAALQNGGEWNGHRILSPLGVKAMRTVPRATASLGRTLGWDNFTAYASNNGDYLGPNTYGHTGYTGTSIVIDPDNDISVILLINAVHPEDGHSVVRLRSLVSNAVAASIYPAPRIYTEHYYKRFLQFMDEPAITSKDIVMVGNSLTEGGGDWNARLNKKNIRNCGIIGDEVMGIYDRLHQILPGHPEKLFLLAGVNDISHDLTADSIVSMIRMTIERIQRESPDTKLYLQSLLPFNESFGRYKKLTGKTNMVPEINAQLETLAKEHKITFINLFPLFTEKGTNVLRSELTSDGLHLNEEGYKIWVKALKKRI